MLTGDAGELHWNQGKGMLEGRQAVRAWLGPRRPGPWIGPGRQLGG